MNFRRTLWLSLFFLSAPVGPTRLSGQAAPPMHSAAAAVPLAPVVPSTELTLRGLDGRSLTFSPADLAELPHKTVAVFNPHTRQKETYSGVVLADLLAKAGVPQAEKVRGALFLTGVVAEGTDGYKVLYSLAEVDPAIHTGDVIVADSMDGKPLASDGAFKLVSTEDKRPARWVRNLKAVYVVAVTP